MKSSHKKMFDKRGPRMEFCGTPDIFFPMHSKGILFSFFVFDSEGNLESFLKQEVTIHKHVVLRLVNHGKYNQALSIGQ